MALKQEQIATGPSNGASCTFGVSWLSGAFINDYDTVIFQDGPNSGIANLLANNGHGPLEIMEFDQYTGIGRARYFNGGISEDPYYFANVFSVSGPHGADPPHAGSFKQIAVWVGPVPLNETGEWIEKNFQLDYGRSSPQQQGWAMGCTLLNNENPTEDPNNGPWGPDEGGGPTDNEGPSDDDPPGPPFNPGPDPGPGPEPGPGGPQGGPDGGPDEGPRDPDLDYGGPYDNPEDTDGDGTPDENKAPVDGSPDDPPGGPGPGPIDGNGDGLPDDIPSTGDNSIPPGDPDAGDPDNQGTLPSAPGNVGFRIKPVYQSVHSSRVLRVVKTIPA